MEEPSTITEVLTIVDLEGRYVLENGEFIETADQQHYTLFRMHGADDWVIEDEMSRERAAEYILIIEGSEDTQ